MKNSEKQFCNCLQIPLLLPLPKSYDSLSILNNFDQPISFDSCASLYVNIKSNHPTANHVQQSQVLSLLRYQT